MTTPEELKKEIEEWKNLGLYHIYKKGFHFGRIEGEKEFSLSYNLNQEKILKEEKENSFDEGYSEGFLAGQLAERNNQYKGLCTNCGKPDEFSKSTLCGNCIKKWKEKVITDTKLASKEKCLKMIDRIEDYTEIGLDMFREELTKKINDEVEK